jgi:hypothetical protein
MFSLRSATGSRPVSRAARSTARSSSTKASVASASRTYKRKNLKFRRASVLDLPLPKASGAPAEVGLFGGRWMSAGLRSDWCRILQ